MSSNLSQITIAGNLTRAPEVKIQSGQTTLVMLSVAMNHRYQNQNGEWESTDPTYVDVQCWGRLAENVRRSLGKGNPVVVTGRLFRSSWTVQEDGEERMRHVLRVRATHVGLDLNTHHCLPVYDEYADARGGGRGGVERQADAREAISDGAAGGGTAGGGTAGGGQKRSSQRKTNRDGSAKKKELAGVGAGAGVGDAAASAAEGAETPPF